MKKKLFISLLFIFLLNFIKANNLQIGAVTVSASGGSQYLNFSIGWENSWRVNNGPTNWDAVWVFVKRRDCAALQWRHVNLDSQDTAHTSGTPLFVDAYADKKGVMIYRNALGSGNISNVNIQLKMDSVVTGNYDYQVFGIEMVYVPEGPFYLGDGSSYKSFIKWPDNNPYFITSEGSIALGQDTSNLYVTNASTGNIGLVAGTILSTNYPKGFNSFYIMKYEISQEQYASFLNNITQDAASNRYLPANAGLERYNISGLWPSLTSSTPDRACGFISFQDLTAYFDWSALSPMSELEYEKSCRGSNNSAVSGEMAWGGISVTDANTIAAGTDGTGTEYVTDNIIVGSGLANYASPIITFSGPLRCGFAARTATNRFQAGATYYGAMEMSGNVMERCYNLAVTLDGGGRFFGTHGDGELSSAPGAGFSNAGWPEEGFATFYIEGYSVADRGGSYSSDNLRLSVSDRYYALNTGATLSQKRFSDYGGRGVSRRQQ